jgi:hypothetical protein
MIVDLNLQRIFVKYKPQRPCRPCSFLICEAGHKKGCRKTSSSLEYLHLLPACIINTPVKRTACQPSLWWGLLKNDFVILSSLTSLSAHCRYSLTARNTRRWIIWKHQRLPCSLFRLSCLRSQVLPLLYRARYISLTW